MSYKEACFDDCSVTHLQFKEFVEALGCPWEHSISCPFLATCLKIHIRWEERVYWHRVTTVTVSIQHLGRNAYWQADNMLWNRKGSHRLLEVRNPFLLFKTGVNLQRGLFSLSCHTAEIFCCCLVEQEIIYLSFIPRGVTASYVEVWTRLALLMQETWSVFLWSVQGVWDGMTSLSVMAAATAGGCAAHFRQMWGCAPCCICLEITTLLWNDSSSILIPKEGIITSILKNPSSLWLLCQCKTWGFGQDIEKENV